MKKPKDYSSKLFFGNIRNLTTSKLIQLIFFLLVFGGTAVLAQPPGKVYNVKDYGAVADNQTVNTTAIQNAINDCSTQGGGSVYFAGGTYLTGTLFLKDNVTLYIETGDTLRGTRDKSDYPFFTPERSCYRCGECRGLIYAEKAKNVGIAGGGVLDGNDAGRKNPWGGVENVRPRLVRFVDCDSVSLKNVTLTRSAMWTVLFQGSTNVYADGVYVNSETGQRNQDGFDIDDCKHVHITNCRFRVGDDAICFKTMSGEGGVEDVLVENCTIDYTRWSAIKFGTETHGYFKDIIIRNCIINECKSGAISIYSVDGARIENILFENIEIRKSATPICLRLGERMRTYEGQEKLPPGYMRNITFRNITARNTIESVGSFISGTPGYLIDSVRFENIDFDYMGGITDTSIVNSIPPEKEDRYPQYNMFKVDMPAYGMYIRHAKNLIFSNIKFTYEESDVRPAIIMEDDVEDYFFINSIDIQSQDNTTPSVVWHKEDGEVHIDVKKIANTKL